MFKPHDSASTHQQFVNNEPDTLVVAFQATPAFIGQHLRNSSFCSPSVPFAEVDRQITMALAKAGIGGTMNVLGFGTKESVSYGASMINGMLMQYKQRNPLSFGQTPQLSGTIAIPPVLTLGQIVAETKNPVIDSPFKYQPHPQHSFPHNHGFMQPPAPIPGGASDANFLNQRLSIVDKTLSVLSDSDQPLGFMQDHEIVEYFANELKSRLPAHGKVLAIPLTQLFIDQLWVGDTGVLLKRFGAAVQKTNAAKSAVLRDLHNFMRNDEREENDGFLDKVAVLIETAALKRRFGDSLVLTGDDDGNTMFRTVYSQSVCGKTLTAEFAKTCVITYLEFARFIKRKELVSGVLTALTNVSAPNPMMQVKENSALWFNIIDLLDQLTSYADELFVSRIDGSSAIGKIRNLVVDDSTLLSDIMFDLNSYSQHLVRQFTTLQACQSDMIKAFKSDDGTSPLAYSTLTKIAMENKTNIPGIDPNMDDIPNDVSAACVLYKAKWEEMAKPIEDILKSLYELVLCSLRGTAETHAEAATYLKVFLIQYQRQELYFQNVMM